MATSAATTCPQHTSYHGPGERQCPPLLPGALGHKAPDEITAGFCETAAERIPLEMATRGKASFLRGTKSGAGDQLLRRVEGLRGALVIWRSTLKLPFPLVILRSGT